MQIDDYRSKFNVVTEIQKYTKDRHCFGIESKKKKKEKYRKHENYQNFPQ